MIIYDWKVISLTKKTINKIHDVVVGVVWEKIGYDEEGYKGSYKVFTQFNVDQVDNNTTFIQYKELTKKDIIGWIELVTDQNKVNRIILENMQTCKDNEVKVVSGDFPWEV